MCTQIYWCLGIRSLVLFPRHWLSGRKGLPRYPASHHISTSGTRRKQKQNITSNLPKIALKNHAYRHTYRSKFWPPVRQKTCPLVPKHKLEASALCWAQESPSHTTSTTDNKWKYIWPMFCVALTWSRVWSQYLPQSLIKEAVTRVLLVPRARCL